MITWTNDELSLWLPPINNADEFKFILNKILKEVLSQGFKYKFEYKFFTHTNDKTKSLEFFLPPISGVSESDLKNPDALQRLKMVYSILYEAYKYHGYSTIYATNEEVTMSEAEFTNWINDVYMICVKRISQANEDLTKDIYIEFKKSTLLKIYRETSNLS